MLSLLKTHIRPDTLHHAYCIEGGGDLLPVFLRFCEDELAIPIKSNPDFWQAEFEVFGIEEGRALKEAQFRTAAGKGKKFFVISAQSLTHEAQNALLKVFEEPTAGSHFFLLLPSASLLLPTLRSRMVIVPRAAAAFFQSPSDFLKAYGAERMEMIKEMSEDKDRKGARELVDALIGHFAQNTRGNATLLEKLLLTRDYLNDRSSGIKMLLEFLAVSIPTGRY